MAIPVENPPPNDPPPSGGGYTPPPPTGDGFGYGAPSGPPARAPMSPVVRGCLIAGAFGLVVACLGSAVLVYSCMGLLSAGTPVAVGHIADSYRAAAVRAGEESTYDADLRQLVAIANEGHLSFLTFGILNNRFEEARRDGNVDTDELHHGMELVHDIVVGNGEIRLESYPNGR